MQAWLFDSDTCSLSRSQVPVPTLGPDDVLIQVLAMGVCHTDVSVASGQLPSPASGARRYVLGHECTGKIVQVGSNVTASTHALGDRVGIHVVPSCRLPDCPQCSRGLHVLCKTNNQSCGFGRDGVFAEYIAVHSSMAVPIPAGLDTHTAAISSDAILTLYHAMKVTAAVHSGQTIAIFGLGGLGLNAIQTALHLGVVPAQIFVVDKRQEPIDRAISLGVPPHNAFRTATPDAQAFHNAISERNVAIDTCIDFAVYPDTVRSAQLALRPGGTLVLVGLGSAETPLLPYVAVMKALTIRGSFYGTVESYRECLELLAAGVLTPQVTTTSVKELPSVLKQLDQGQVTGRMVLLPDWNE